MKKVVKKAKKVVVKKAPKLVKSVAPKEPKKVKVVEVPVKVSLNNDCPACKGIGLARPEFVASPVCPVCNGSGKQN